MCNTKNLRTTERSEGVLKFGITRYKELYMTTKENK